MKSGVLAIRPHPLAVVGLLVAAGSAAWVSWQSRPYPAAAAPFVFRDGFEDAAKIEDLFSDLGKWWFGKTFRAARTAPKFPKDRWVELRLHLFLSEDSDGKMEVWQDGTKVIDATGQTLPTARTIYDRLQVGLTANGNRQHAQTLFVDDIILSNRPLE